MKDKYKKEIKKLKLFLMGLVPFAISTILVVFTILFVDSKSTDVGTVDQSLPIPATTFKAASGIEDSNTNITNMLQDITYTLPLLSADELSFMNNKCKKTVFSFVDDIDIFKELDTSINFPFGIFIPFFKFTLNYLVILEHCLAGVDDKLGKDSNDNVFLLKSAINQIISSETLGVYITVILNTKRLIAKASKPAFHEENSLFCYYSKQMEMLVNLMKEFTMRLKSEIQTLLNMVKSLELVDIKNYKIDEKQHKEVLYSVIAFKNIISIIPTNIIIDTINLFYSIQCDENGIVLEKRMDFNKNSNNKFIGITKNNYLIVLKRMVYILSRDNLVDEMIVESGDDKLIGDLSGLLKFFMDSSSNMIFSANKKGSY